MSYEQLQRMYATDAYYWGKEPNDFALLTLEFLTGEASPDSERRAVDIGAGEGRDAVLFAGHGFDTLAVDFAPNALEKAARLAREKGVRLRTEQGNVNSLELAGAYDLVYSIGAIQYIEPANREARFDHFRQQTASGGLHAMFAFVDHPSLPPAPDWGEDEHLYAPGELPSYYYAGWECLYSRAFTFSDDSGGLPHQHAAEEYVFQSPHWHRNAGEVIQKQGASNCNA